MTDPDYTTCCLGYGWVCAGACLNPEKHRQRSDCANPEECLNCNPSITAPDPKQTRKLLFQVFGYLTAVDFDNRDAEWDTLIAQVGDKLKAWKPYDD